MKRTNTERLIARLEKEVKEAKKEEKRTHDEPNEDWDLVFEEQAEARGVVEGLETALKLVKKYLEKIEKEAKVGGK